MVCPRVAVATTFCMVMAAFLLAKISQLPVATHRRNGSCLLSLAASRSVFSYPIYASKWLSYRHGTEHRIFSDPQCVCELVEGTVDCYVVVTICPEVQLDSATNMHVDGRGSTSSLRGAKQIYVWTQDPSSINLSVSAVQRGDREASPHHDTDQGGKDESRGV